MKPKRDNASLRLSAQLKSLIDPSSKVKWDGIKSRKNEKKKKTNRSLPFNHFVRYIIRTYHIYGNVEKKTKQHCGTIETNGTDGVLVVIINTLTHAKKRKILFNICARAHAMYANADCNWCWRRYRLYTKQTNMPLMCSSFCIKCALMFHVNRHQYENIYNKPSFYFVFVSFCPILLLSEFIFKSLILCMPFVRRPILINTFTSINHKA